MPPMQSTNDYQDHRIRAVRSRLRVLFLIVAASALSCVRSDRVTSPSASARASNKALSNADLVGTNACGATCALFNNSDPLWSAIADPDSTAIPVSIADIRFAPAVGDSVVLRLSGDSALIATITANELVDVSDGVSHASVSLPALTSAAVVWRFASSDSTTLHVTLNRTLATGASGNLALTASNSASVVSAARPWIAAGTGSSGLQLSASRLAGIHRLNDAAPPCTGSVKTSGPFCGGSGFALFDPTPVSPANAFGAAFQSPPPGHGASTTITVTFIPPVASVTVKCDDPTFDGNQMEAFDIHHVSLGVVAFPGNQTPGKDVPQTGTISGAIKYLVLTPARADYVAYTMTVTLASPASLTVSSVAGPNAGGSFTTLAKEDTVSLTAAVVPSSLAPQIQWFVTDDPSDRVQTVAPSAVPNGTPSTFTVPAAQMTARYTAYTHPGALDQKSLSLRVWAQVTDAGGHLIPSADTATVRQNEIDTIREEYVEFNITHGVPAYGKFKTVTLDTYQNRGDFTFAILDSTFMAKVAQLQAAFMAAHNGSPWQYNVFYRDPVHNRYHADSNVGGGPSSGVDLNSWHQYGCATDIQTFPVPRRTAADTAAALNYHSDLSALARSSGFHVEPLIPRNGQLGSGVGHVHVHSCPQ